MPYAVLSTVCLVGLVMLPYAVLCIVGLGYGALCWPTHVCIVGLVMLPYTVLSIPSGLGYAALCSPIYA